MFSSKKKQVDLSRLAKTRSKHLKKPHRVRAARRQVWSICSIKYRSGEIREAVIINVTKSGVRIRFRSKGRLPEVVEIKSGRLGLNRTARVVWQKSFDAGLSFVLDEAS
jgi:hypothetical protein